MFAEDEVERDMMHVGSHIRRHVFKATPMTCQFRELHQSACCTLVCLMLHAVEGNIVKTRWLAYETGPLITQETLKA